jgi:glucosamine kinase
MIRAMQQRYLLGVDGGGTRCRARLTDGDGRVLGEGTGGPANLTLGVDVALRELMDAAHAARRAAGLPDDIFAATHAGLGLAGANVPDLAQAVETADLPFSTWTVASDAAIACLGAFDGEDGGILILGTGSQGLAHVGGRMTTVGGWGFYLSDDASGAILGRAAIRHALKAVESLAPSSPLTDAIMAHFDHKPANIAHWGPTARPSDYGSFVPLIATHLERGDIVATALVEAAGKDAASLIDRLLELGAGRIALMGGLATIFRPYLPERLAPYLVDPRGDALDGALLMARRHAEGQMPQGREAAL